MDYFSAWWAGALMSPREQGLVTTVVGFFLLMFIFGFVSWLWSTERIARRGGCICPFRQLWTGHSFPVVDPSCPYHAREDGRLR